MLTSIIISIITIIALIISIIFIPSMKIKKVEFQTFWIVAIVGALLIILTKCITVEDAISTIIDKKGINPIEILILFISMSILSITLDEAGFFKTCAYYATNISKKSQIKLFVSISVVVSLLTIFTSNDIVILTFTPFICYFAKNTKINPIPYIIGEFVFANTWSMMLMIGNPTNIFLSASFGITFFGYFKVMVIPTFLAGITACLVLLIMFRKDFRKPIDGDNTIEKPIINKFVNFIGLVHLLGCIVLLTVSSYIEIEMWLVCAIFALNESVILIIYNIAKKDTTILSAYKRAPWNLIPFVISMFIIVASLNKNGVVVEISKLLDKVAVNKTTTIFSYGLSSFFATNLINNIPMSVLFKDVILNANNAYINEMIYSTIIASNVGAYLTPIGALAGIMWMSILKKMDVEFKFIDFVKKGIIISIIVIIVSLASLCFLHI